MLTGIGERMRTKNGILLECLLIFIWLSGVAFAANIQYTYDSLNRLIKVDYGNGTTIQYTYDADGNRVTKITQSPVNGACGSSNGGTFTSAPTSNLCSSGTASSVSGSGPWSWTCAGANGGTDATCSANLTAAVTLSNLNQTYSGTPISATVSTDPSGLTASVTYNGSTTPPTAVGSYAVVATVTEPGYTGSATGTLTISVAPSPVSLVVTSSVTKTSNGYQAAVKVTNNGGSEADNVELTGATLGVAAGSPLPYSLGNIAGGDSATATVTFPSSAGVSGSWKLLRLGGTYSGGTFSSGRWVKLP